MRTFTHIHSRVLIGCALFWLVLLSQSLVAWAAPVAGYVKDLKGQITASQAGERRPLSDMSPVFVADEIESDASGGAQLHMVDESSVFLGPGSKLVVADMGFVEVDGKVSQHVSMNVKAVSGAFRFVTGKVAKANPDNFKVETPMGLIGVRGTDFSSLVSQGFERHRLNSGGPLWVRDHLGNQQNIFQSGFGLELRPGHPMGPPVPMSMTMLSLGGGHVSLAHLTEGPGHLGSSTGPVQTTPTTDLPSHLSSNATINQAYSRYSLSRTSSTLSLFGRSEQGNSLQAVAQATRWYEGSETFASSSVRVPKIATNEPYVGFGFYDALPSRDPFLTGQYRLPGGIGARLDNFAGLDLGSSLTSNGLSYTGFGSMSLSVARMTSVGQRYYQELAEDLRKAGFAEAASKYDPKAASFDASALTTQPVGLWQYGVPTVRDLPTTGEATYRGSMVGLWSYNDPTPLTSGSINGTVTSSVDFARDRITDFALNFTGCTYVDRLAGTGSVTRATNAGVQEFGLNGSFDASRTGIAFPSAGPIVSQSGSFNGRFHGPAGVEMGGSFGWTGNFYNFGLPATVNVVGVFGAAR